MSRRGPPVERTILERPEEPTGYMSAILPRAPKCGQNTHLVALLPILETTVTLVVLFVFDLEILDQVGLSGKTTRSLGIIKLVLSV